MNPAHFVPQKCTLASPLVVIKHVSVLLPNDTDVGFKAAQGELVMMCILSISLMCIVLWCCYCTSPTWLALATGAV